MKINTNIKTAILVLIPYLWLIVFLLVPFLIIIAISISNYNPTVIPPFDPFIYKSPEGQWSLNISWESFKILAEDRFYIKAYWSSIKLAAITTVCTLIIGYPIAMGIFNSKKNLRSIFLLAVILPFWTSLVIRVYAWAIILGDVGILNNLLLSIGFISSPIQFLNTKFAVIVGMVYCYLPFMVLPLYIAIEKIDRSVIEASLDLGCNPFETFIRVILPLSMPGIIAGSMLVFIPAVGEVIIPDLLGGNSVLTLGKVIWKEFFTNRDWPMASAITVILTLTFVVPLTIVQNVVSKQKNENEE